MPIDLAQRLVTLYEQQSSAVSLLPEEAKILREDLGFDVFYLGADVEIDGPADENRSFFQVNPEQFVGHLALSTGTIITIRPKIPAANVFRMLGYVYAGWSKEIFDEEDVSYAQDDFLFEPFVQRFNRLVSDRARRGLLQDYIRIEDNLRVMKGSVSFGRHIRSNVPAHPDRLFCTYHENTWDIEDNQIVKWTLFHLMRSSQAWSDQTLRMLRSNFHQFEAVSLTRPNPAVFDRHHYHRLNEDYRLIHGLSRMFLDNISISEVRGETTFHGYLLDMNVLFQRFVTEAFFLAAKGTTFSIHTAPCTISENRADFPLKIIPDLTVIKHGNPVSIADAKYKKTENGLINSDFYQVISYGTGRNCPRTYLFYPSSEYTHEGQIQITNTPLTIDIRRVNIEDKQCVDLMEQAARRVLAEVLPRTATV
jgi:5-methylcytosine-specific restriction enzyme subunit McrC